MILINQFDSYLSSHAWNWDIFLWQLSRDFLYLALLNIHIYGTVSLLDNKINCNTISIYLRCVLCAQWHRIGCYSSLFIPSFNTSFYCINAQVASICRYNILQLLDEGSYVLSCCEILLRIFRIGSFRVIWWMSYRSDPMIKSN